MSIYIPKPGAWFLPFIPVRCLALYGDAGLFAGFVRRGWRIEPDEEDCRLDEFWVVRV